MSVTIFVPPQLRTYTQGASKVAAEGADVDAALTNLSARFPGLKFRVIDEQGRIREHMRIFVDGERVRDIASPVRTNSEIHVFGALSGG